MTIGNAPDLTKVPDPDEPTVSDKLPPRPAENALKRMAQGMQEWLDSLLHVKPAPPLADERTG